MKNKTYYETGKKVESSKFIENFIKNSRKYIPPVDYSTASNFVRYGLAEQYYEDSIKRIYKTYPYDGSRAEKEEWKSDSSPLDIYLYDNLYPRTNGYISIGNNWGTQEFIASGYGAPSTASYEYIQIKGGPNLGFDLSGDRETQKKAKNIFKNSNKYDESKKRQSNLEFNTTGTYSGSNNGITVEFWYKKESFVSTFTDKEVIFDLWNGQSTTSNDYGRLTIETDNTAAASPFRITVASGAIGVQYQTIGVTPTHSSVGGGTWNHYAFTFRTVDGDLESKLYINGKLDDTKTYAGQGIQKVTGSLIANIGALRTAPQGTTGPVEGHGKMHSASLDEFRFWKVERTEEEIERYWNTHVGGGSNTDDETTTLGVYYKFNEGITQTSSIDSLVLDYSGRVSNGSWVGYEQSLTPRSTDSAIVESGYSISEYKDPIVYSFHPNVLSFLSEMTNAGYEHDLENNASLWSNIPDWIVEEDSSKGTGDLKKLTQIMASSLDYTYLLIENLTKYRNINYPSEKNKPIPFVKELLSNMDFETHKMFDEATVIETFLNKGREGNYEDDVSEIKNIIYQNIYNNLPQIYKQKGTKESFRNLLRCFGVDSELMKLNVYSDGEEYTFKDNFDFSSKPRNLVNFYYPDHLGGTVFQTTASGDTINTRSFISASSVLAKNDYTPFTVETEFVFPKKFDQVDRNFIQTNFISSSLFGFYPALSSDQNVLTWQTPNTASIQVYAVKEELYSKRAKFVLTGTVVDEFPVLTSSYYPDIYDDEKWNFSVSIRHNKYPYTSYVSGTKLSNEGSYILEFFGVNTTLDVVPKIGNQEKSFYLTASLTYDQGQSMLRSDKRIYAGAHRTNFTGSILYNTDVCLSSVRAWLEYLPTSSVINHSKYNDSYGIKGLFEGAGTYDENFDNIFVPKSETLLFDWYFSSNTGSDSSGEFFVYDETSGSAEQAGRYGEYGTRIGIRHPGRGYGFTSNSDDAFKLNYLPTLKRTLPESLSSANMIEILDENTEVRTKETRPSKYIFRFEKSMYQNISEDMINYLDTIVEFNNLIGEPVNRYRKSYKKLDKLRHLYFSKVENEPDLERFLEFYKWIDSAVVKMLSQMLPASTKTPERIANTVESHVFERNKFQHKFPFLEIKTSTTGNIKGHKPYQWKDYHAPIGLSEEENGLWWNKKSKLDTNIWNLNADVESNRLAIGRIQDEKTNRNEKNPYFYSLSRTKELGGGVNFNSQKRFVYVDVLHPNGPLYQNLLVVSGAFLEEPRSKYNTKQKDAAYHPIKTKKYKFSVYSNKGNISGSGKELAPFTIVSSSVSGVLAGNNSKNLAIANYHHDQYGREKPFQGPFTEEHVGGYQWRHIALNTGSNLDDRSNRPEKFGGIVDGTEFLLVPSDYESTNNPPASWSRDGLVKRYLNVKNIKTLTTRRVLGNFNKNYQVVSTTGRTDNNIYFRRNMGISGTNIVSSSLASNLINYGVARRDLTGSLSVFAVRFNAPGGLETSNGFLDVEANELSVYNSLNWRNWRNRTQLNEFWNSASYQYGIDNVASPVSASEHKMHRNTFYRIEKSGSSFVTASVNNTFLFTNSIPSSDLNYTWIRKTATTASGNPINNQNVPFRYSVGSTHDNKHRSITFVSQSDFGSYKNLFSGIRYFGLPNPYVPAAEFIPVDYVNLNTIIYEPITSSTNTLGYPSLVATDIDGDNIFTANYINKVITPGDGTEETQNTTGIPGLASILQAINCHRNGAGGWEVWKQTRIANHPVARHMRRNNIFSVAKTPTQNLLQGDNFIPIKPYEFENYIESCVDNNNYPLQVLLEISGNVISLNNSYSNVVNAFAEEKLNIDAVNREKYTKYQDLFDLYGNPDSLYRDNFIELRYKESVFPTKKYINISRNRRRTFFLESGGYGHNGFDRNVYQRTNYWPDTIERTDIDGATPFKNAVDYRWGRSVYPFGNSRIWHKIEDTAYIPILEIRERIKTGSYDGELSNFTTSSVTNFPYVDANVQGMLGSGQSYLSGALVSDAMPSFVYDYPTASLQYAYLPNIGKFTEYNWPYDVFKQSGKRPWYDSYEEYAKDITVLGKGYSTLAEFKISNHIEDYIKSGFFQENKNWLSNQGSYVSQSAESSTGSYIEDFFEQYTNSDLMKHFEKFIEDHRSVNGEIKHLTLTCDVVKKMLPYNGFYPINRTTQLGSLFSQSLAPYISGSNYETDSGAARALQSALQPYFAPGIVFNTIKSGIAVDWPYFTGSSDYLENLWQNDGGKSLSSGTPPSPFCLYISSSGPELGITATDDWKCYLLSSSFDSTDGNAGKFHGRLAFESLVNLEKSLLKEKNIFLMAPDKINQSSGSANSEYPYFSWSGEKKPFFEMAMHNFLAEVPNFFLKNKNLTSFVSKPEKNFQPLVKDVTYYMDVVLKKTNDFNMIASHHSSSIPSGSTSALAVTWGDEQSYHGRYFGPPSYKFTRGDTPGYGSNYNSDISTDQLDVRATNMGDPAYAPFTPPYFYGESRIRLSFQPSETRKYSIDEIFSNALASSSNQIALDGVDEFLPFAQNNVMTLESSVNLFEKENSLISGDSTGLDSWKIVPKFECPTLNFTEESLDVGGQDSGYQTASLARGMWGTYGSLPTGSEGIYFSLEESFPQVLNANLNDSDTIGSLIQVCGFTAAQKRIGEINDKTKIYEAIIAIPYVERELKDGVNIANRNFFRLKEEEIEKDSSIDYMMNKVKDYYLPPFMDFTNPNSEVNPFVFYIFEFEEELDKQDLADIWQGVMPKPATRATKQKVTLKHPISQSEMFFDHTLPSDMRWLIFKVKRRARKNYFQLFDKSKEKGLESDVDTLIKDYNYNWPYDFFSLVELAKFDVEWAIGKKDEE